MAKKIKICILFLSLIFLDFGYVCSWGEDVPQEAKQAAIQGSQMFLRHLAREDYPAVNFELNGFYNKEEIKQAQLGDAIWIYSIDQGRISSYDGKSPVLTVASRGDALLFPIVVSSQIRTFLSVNLINGTWQATGLGEVPLAKQWESVVKEYPSQNGYQHSLIVIPEGIPTHFPMLVLLKYADKFTMFPLSDWGKLKRNKEYDPAYILCELKQRAIELEKFEKEHPINDGLLSGR